MRTVVKEGNNTKETTGIKCTLDSAELKASVITPAKVRIPVMQGQSTQIYGKCTGGGMTGTQTVQPNLQGTAVGGSGTVGLVAAIVSTAIVASQDKWG